VLPSTSFSYWRPKLITAVPHFSAKEAPSDSPIWSSSRGKSKSVCCLNRGQDGLAARYRELLSKGLGLTCLWSSDGVGARKAATRELTDRGWSARWRLVHIWRASASQRQGAGEQKFCDQGIRGGLAGHLSPVLPSLRVGAISFRSGLSATPRKGHATVGWCHLEIVRPCGTSRFVEADQIRIQTEDLNGQWPSNVVTRIMRRGRNQCL
jgi:hypothetical protein